MPALAPAAPKPPAAHLPREVNELVRLLRPSCCALMLGVRLCTAVPRRMLELCPALPAPCSTPATGLTRARLGPLKLTLLGCLDRASRALSLRQ